MSWPAVAGTSGTSATRLSADALLTFAREPPTRTTSSPGTSEKFFPESWMASPTRARSGERRRSSGLRSNLATPNAPRHSTATSAAATPAKRGTRERPGGDEGLCGTASGRRGAPWRCCGADGRGTRCDGGGAVGVAAGWEGAGAVALEGGGGEAALGGGAGVGFGGIASLAGGSAAGGLSGDGRARAGTGAGAGAAGAGGSLGLDAWGGGAPAAFGAGIAGAGRLAGAGTGASLGEGGSESSTTKNPSSTTTGAAGAGGAAGACATGAGMGDGAGDTSWAEGASVAAGGDQGPFGGAGSSTKNTSGSSTGKAAEGAASRRSLGRAGSGGRSPMMNSSETSSVSGAI